MARLFRCMRPAADGYPEVGPSNRTLGVRPGIDVPAVNAGDTVHPGTGGVSVSPDDPMNLPSFRRPPAYGGTAKDPVWVIDEIDLGPDRVYRPDPARATHGFLEPARPMSLTEYEQAVDRTRDRWQRFDPATHGGSTHDV